jgi:hypothetical protein
MGLWLLSFTEHEVAIIVEAETLTHARLLSGGEPSLPGFPIR